MKNILLSAFSCYPDKGSEPGVGWNWLVEISKYNKVWVLIYEGEGQKNAVEKAVSKLPQKENIQILAISVPTIFQNRLFRIRYEIWQIFAYQYSKKLIKKVKFDIIHHVTIAAWWNCGYLWKLNIPFIFGPISGFQMIPLKALGFLKLRDRTKEIFRNLLVIIGRKLHTNFRNAVKKAEIIFCANEATFNYFRKTMKLEKALRLSEVGVNERILKEDIKNNNKNASPLILIWSGAFYPSKNFGLLLESLRALPKSLDYQLIALGDGKNLKYWKRKTKEYKLSDKILFKGLVPLDEVKTFYAVAHIFVFPSLREASGTVILEAMSAGLPTIALNINGAKNLLDNESGILINITNKEKMIKDFADAIIRLNDNPDLRKNMGENARERALKNFSWKSRGEYMNEVYTNILMNKL